MCVSVTTDPVVVAKDPIIHCGIHCGYLFFTECQETVILRVSKDGSVWDILHVVRYDRHLNSHPRTQDSRGGLDVNNKVRQVLEGVAEEDAPWELLRLVELPPYLEVVSCIYTILSVLSGWASSTMSAFRSRL